MTISNDHYRALAFANIAEEYRKANSEFGPFHSAHEGYAILLEEVDELWDEIKIHDKDLDKIYNEAKQVAAMALQMMICTHIQKDEQR